MIATRRRCEAVPLRYDLAHPLASNAELVANCLKCIASAIHRSHLRGSGLVVVVAQLSDHRRRATTNVWLGTQGQVVTATTSIPWAPAISVSRAWGVI